MQRRALLCLAAAAMLSAAAPSHADDGVVVIAHPTLRGIDADALKRIYSGRMVEFDGQALSPVNLPSGQAARRRFLASLLQQSEEDYVAYWTVRRYIGKGAPPRELASAAELIAYVQRTPGAIGYIDQADLRPGSNLNVVLRR